VNAEDNLEKAWNEIIQNGFLSIPVIKDKKPLGFIDVFDILSFITKGNVGHKFTEAKCESVTNFSENDAMIRVVDSSELWTTANVMVDFGKLHRVPIIKNDQLVGLISQGDIIAYIQSFIESDPIGDKTIQELELGIHKTVITISKNDTVRNGFQKILDNNVSGIAVTAQSDDLYAALSATDIIHFGILKDLKELDIKIEEFLKTKIPPNTTFGLNPVFVTPADTLKILIKKLTEGHVHRVFIVGDLMKVIGIISLIDVIKFLTKAE